MPEHHGDLFSVVVMAFRRKRQYEETEEPWNTRCRSPCSRPCTRRHFLAALACKTEEESPVHYGVRLIAIVSSTLTLLRVAPM